ncbi:unnamed protein product [Owenia fusiformis]|uniref:Cyclin-F n=1 Tax=Owenia fusiformis TaxID=6347 RepID=A0A8J1XZD7_OWEFU|nr:unnamed protein product [Owenia fusiformis]
MKVVSHKGRRSFILRRQNRNNSGWSDFTSSSSYQHTSYTSHIQLKPRTRSDVTIWSLPEELLIHLMKGLHIKDLLNIRSVHSHFRDIIDSYSTLWSGVSFRNAWPSLPNMLHFERAAENGNIESLIKLGIAYLYNEGLPGDFEGKKILANGTKAAEMFCRVESLTPHTAPFTWLFIRPPWTVSGACCKECVFNDMVKYCAKHGDPSVQICVAKTLLLLEDEETRNMEAVTYLEQATSHSSPLAAFLLWEQRYSNIVCDRAMELQSIRELRDISCTVQIDSQLRLCQFYAQGKYGGVSARQAASFMRDLVLSSQPTNLHLILTRNVELTQSMRYILVDWLVEVAGMKDFSSLTLHVAINMVDRYLKVHATSRSKLQLLGVAAMVVCSRYLGKDIITIREAAWLTDNAYKYEDVVRMMGEIIATLKGEIRVITSLDLVKIFGQLAKLEQTSQYLAEYICELSLLKAEIGQYTQAKIAASCVLFARLAMKQEFPWPSHMEDFTGLSVEDLKHCVLKLHEKSFTEGSMVDHRDIILQAVKQRYSDEQFSNVSNIEILTARELCQALGLSDLSSPDNDVRIYLHGAKDLIASPSRGNHRNRRNRPSSGDRAATPTMDSDQNMANLLNESAMSGYDGDKEDEGESFIDCEDFDDDEDLVSLWGPDQSRVNNSESLTFPNMDVDDTPPIDLNQNVRILRHRSPTRYCSVNKYNDYKGPTEGPHSSTENNTTSDVKIYIDSDHNAMSSGNISVVQGSSSNSIHGSMAHTSASTTLTLSNITGNSNIIKHYETRSQSKLNQVSNAISKTRTAFQSLPIDSANGATTSKTRTNSKRKSTNQMGNENKLQVLS